LRQKTLTQFALPWPALLSGPLSSLSNGSQVKLKKNIYT
jgi:hypothetical protein